MYNFTFLLSCAEKVGGRDLIFGPIKLGYLQLFMPLLDLVEVVMVEIERANIYKLVVISLAALLTLIASCKEVRLAFRWSLHTIFSWKIRFLMSKYHVSLI